MAAQSTPLQTSDRVYQDGYSLMLKEHMRKQCGNSHNDHIKNSAKSVIHHTMISTVDVYQCLSGYNDLGI